MYAILWPNLWHCPLQFWRYLPMFTYPSSFYTQKSTPNLSITSPTVRFPSTLNPSVSFKSVEHLIVIWYCFGQLVTKYYYSNITEWNHINYIFTTYCVMKIAIWFLFKCINISKYISIDCGVKPEYMRIMEVWILIWRSISVYFEGF